MNIMLWYISLFSFFQIQVDVLIYHLIHYFNNLVYLFIEFGKKKIKMLITNIKILRNPFETYSDGFF